MAQPAAAAAAAAAGAALQQDKIIKKSTDLPWYYGIPTKETISASDLIDRLEAAAPIAGWDTDEKKIRELYLLFREEAIVWWKSTKKSEDCTITDWESVKKAFLLNYEPKITARTTCTNLADLAQRPNEVANRYYLRLFATFDKLQSTYPDNRKTVRFTPANAAAADAAEQLKIKAEGIEDAFRFFEHQQFLAGLRDPIRSEVMKAGKATVTASKAYATELEAISMKDTLTPLTRGIASLEETPFSIPNHEWPQDMLPSIPADLFTDEEFEQVNLIRRRNGKLPFKRTNFKKPSNGNGNGNKSNGNNNGNISCRYCKKKGHMQRECKSRLRDNAPMVDANGKPFSRNNVHAVDAEDEGQTGIASVMLAENGTGLNWF